MDTNQASNNPYSKIRDIGIVFILFYVVALIFPKAFWGLNHLYFLPTIFKPLIFLLVGYLLFMLPSTLAKSSGKLLNGGLPWLDNFGWMALVAFVMSALFYLFPIYYDMYGDAAFLFESDNYVVEDISWEGMAPLYSFDYTNPKIGTGTNFSLVALFSYLFEMSAQQVFRIWDAFCGGLFLLFWLKLVQLLNFKPGWKLLAVVLGLFAPFLQNFFGHYEVYAPVIAGMAAYFYFLVKFYHSRKGKHFVILIFIFLLALKFHVTIYLLLPSLGLAFVWWLGKEKLKNQLFTLKGSLKFILAPMMIIGGALYVYMGGFEGKRSYTEDNLAEVVFLPFSAAEGAPLDRYNLLSPVHFFDCFNQMFLWSGAGVFLLVSLLVVFRKRINWNQPLLLIVGASLVAYLGFFFVLNPLLSMPNDWDLFSMPAISLLVFILLLIKQVEEVKVPPYLAGGVLALSLFSITIFQANATRSSLSERLVMQGEWEFQTYWLGSSSSIVEGLKLEEDNEVRQNKLLKVIAGLEPYAVKGNDLEYAELLHQTGIYYTKDSIVPPLALKYFKESNLYSTEICKNQFYLMDAYFKVGELDKALEHGERVIRCEYPNKLVAYEANIHAALEVGNSDLALTLCNEILIEIPDEPFLLNVKNTLENGGDARMLFGGNAQKVNVKENFVDTASNQNSVVILANTPIFTETSKDSLKSILMNYDTVTGLNDYVAVLNMKIGQFYYETLRIDSSLIYYSRARQYTNNQCEINYHQLICLFMLGDFVEANSLTQQLVECGYPNPQKAYKMAMHTTAMAGDLQSLKSYVNGFLNRWPKDQFANNIKNAIDNGASMQTISSLFKKG